jgi:hypothetical protein
MEDVKKKLMEEVKPASQKKKEKEREKEKEKKKQE